MIPNATFGIAFWAAANPLLKAISCLVPNDIGE